MDEPNAIWTADFKGQFRTRDGQYVYPLTVVDGYSRYLLGCQGLRSTSIQLARPVFRRLFEEYGLPRIIRTDNGVPFATTTLGRLSRLSVWWIRLGIYPELIEPAHPEQNGRHERMHRTLKAETTRPPRGNLGAQQARFNEFRREFNEDRPHEALGQETPASVYHASPRKLPRELPRIEYPGHFEVRLGQSELRNPLEESPRVRDPHTLRGIRRSRRGRRRNLGRILRAGQARSNGRTQTAD